VGKRGSMPSPSCGRPEDFSSCRGHTRHTPWRDARQPHPSGREDGASSKKTHTGRSRSADGQVAEAKPTRRWSIDQDQCSYTNHNQPTNSSGLSSTLTPPRWQAACTFLFPCFGRDDLLFYFQSASFASPNLSYSPTPLYTRDDMIQVLAGGRTTPLYCINKNTYLKPCKQSEKKLSNFTMTENATMYVYARFQFF
jgi:hypothetical protein